MLTTIQVNGQPVQVVTLPPLGQARTVEWTFADAVAINRSPFTGATQTYVWPGADSWCSPEKPGTVTLPPMPQSMADAWISALMECRGPANPFLLHDPVKLTLAGNLQGSVPLVDGSTLVPNTAGTTQLAVKGLVPNAFGLLVNDNVQVGYRVHRAIGRVNSDANGKAVLVVWPSLREMPPDGLALRFGNPMINGVASAGLSAAAGPVGLFRRASNVETWSATVGRLTSLSFQVMEYR